MKVPLYPQKISSSFALILLALGACVVASQSGAATVVFDEPFNYASTAQLQAAWTKVDTTQGFLTLGTSSSVTPDEPYAVLPNSLQSRSLGTTLTKDWTMTFQMLQTAVQRGSWLGLLDSTGQSGYGVLWDSGNNGLTSQGTVTIRKFSLASPISSWSTNGTQIGSSAASGHQITAEPLANFSLSWEAATGKLSVSVDGTQLIQVTDTSFTSFSTLYVKGNTSQYLDNIVVSTVPEPSEIALLACGLGVLALAGRRRLLGSEASSRCE